MFYVANYCNRCPNIFGDGTHNKNIRVVGHHQTFKLIKPLLQPNAAVSLTAHGGFLIFLSAKFYLKLLHFVANGDIITLIIVVLIYV